MNRITHATKKVDLFGAGKHGFSDGVPGVEAATVLNSASQNPIQEELARAVEAFTTLNAGDLGQLSTILTTLLTAAGGSSTLQESSSTPVLSTPNDASDHPSSASNIWKLIVRAPCPNGAFMRLYAGDGNVTGSWCITYNAVWNPASGSQTWSQDQSGHNSSQLMVRTVTAYWRGKAAGAGPWAENAWAAEGDLHLARDLYVDRDAIIAGDATVTGSIVNPKASGTYGFTTPTDRTVNIDIGGCTTNGDWGTTSQELTLGIGESAIFGLHVPHGCVLKGVKLKVAASLGTANYTVACTRRWAIDYTITSSPSYTLVDQDSTSVTSGVANNTAVDFGSLTASRDESYSVLVVCTGGSTSDLVIQALAVVVSEVQLGVAL